MAVEVGVAHELGDRHVEGHGHPRRRCRSGCASRVLALPALARPVEMPRAVHPHVRAQRQAAGEAHQQVLAARLAALDGAAGDRRVVVDARQRRQAGGEGGHDACRRARGAARRRRARSCRLQASSTSAREPCGFRRPGAGPPAGAARAAAGRRWSRRSRPRRSSAPAGSRWPARRSAPRPASRGARRARSRRGAPARAPAPGRGVDRSGSSSGTATSSCRSPRPIQATAWPSTSTTRAPATRLAFSGCRPHVGQSTSAPYGLAGSVAATVTATGRRRGVAFRAQQIDRAGLGELRAAQAGDEVAAAHAAGVLEPAQHRVDGAEAARHRLERGDVAGDHAVARQQLLRERRRPRGGRRPFRASTRPTSGPRPTAGTRRRERKRCGPRLAPRSLRAGDVGAQRMQRVVGHQPLPHQVPQRVDRLLREAAAGRLVQRPEERGAALVQPGQDARLALEQARRSPAGGASSAQRDR